SFYNYGDQRLAQGRENAKTFLAENADLAREIELKIRSESDMLPLADTPFFESEDGEEFDAEGEEAVEAAEMEA
ncbi:MAG: hypothetical protein ACK2US_06435, partial [Anaerolineae bacterium]